MENVRKTALITGASSGLGVWFSRVLAEDGYDLVTVARREGALLEQKAILEKEFGITVTVLAKDLSRSEAVDEIYDYCINNGIEVHTLINNAGFGDFGKFSERNLKKQTDMIAVNITALTALTHKFMRGMIDRGDGRILNVASIAGFEPGPLMSVYYATKAYVISFTEALSVELKGTGVSILALCPGPTDTGFEDAASAKSSGLFKNMKVASAEKVVRFSYKKLKKGRVLVIQGFINKLVPFACRFVPRAFMRKCVYKVMKARRASKD